MGCGCSRELTPSEVAIEEYDIATLEMSQKLDWHHLQCGGASDSRKRKAMKEYRRDWKAFNGRRPRYFWGDSPDHSGRYVN
ncbi:hypothetical protein CSHISOI_11387 [Colletotrichum shisoi]|uniref:Uncharacterized protein n=1 Tax=Colletotrichum shisoi TaxID=2078593 RepID=A0A5Q4BAS5_9PEZI|nr:hypothetical protein CSHISOI_11387 [Colletotrichum shisoi]